jgi:hypothetical protein
VSEFSESVHLRTENPYDVVELLKRAKVAGYVFPAHRGWVSFVHSQGTRAGDSDNRAKLEEANNKGSVLLFYDYAADHGCWVHIHEGKKPVGRLKASFEQPSSRFDRATFERLALLSQIGANEIEAWVKRAHIFHERSGNKAYVVAERLGLPRYKWFSYRSELDTQTIDPERIEVFADGKIKAPPAKVAPHVALPTSAKKMKSKAKTKTKAKAKKVTSKKSPSSKKKTASKTKTKTKKSTASKKKK